MLTPEPLAGQSSILLISSIHHPMNSLMIFMTKAGFAVAHRFPLHTLHFFDSFQHPQPHFGPTIHIENMAPMLSLLRGWVLYYYRGFILCITWLRPTNSRLFPIYFFVSLFFPISILFRQGLF